MTKQTYEGARGWQVIYQVAPNSGQEPDPDLASIVTILELSPEGERGSVEGGEEATIAGHQVSLHRASGGETSHIVQWKTERARYIALVGGDTLGTLRQIVACMP